MEELIGEGFLIAGLYSLEQVDEELVLPGRGKSRVNLAVGLESSRSLDQILETETNQRFAYILTIENLLTYLCCEVADSCLQEVVFDRPLHEVVSDGLTSNALIVRDRLVVVPFEGSQISHLQEVLVCKTELGTIVSS